MIEVPVSPPAYRPPPLPFREAYDIGTAYGHGWQAVKTAPMALWVGGLLMSITDGCGGGSGGGGSDDDRGLSADGAGDMDQTFSGLTDGLSDPVTWVLIALVGLVVVALVIALFLLFCWIRPGYIRLHLHVMEGRSDVSPLFSGRDCFRQMILYHLYTGLITFGALLVGLVPVAVVIGLMVSYQSPLLIGLLIVYGAGCLVGLVYLLLGFAFGDYFIALEGANGPDALKKSWELARGNRLWLVLFRFVGSLVQFGAAIVGLLALCVGILATVPLARSLCDVAFTSGFVRHRYGPPPLGASGR